MRPLALLVASSLLLLDVSGASQGRGEPFVPVGVWYGGGTVRPPRTPRDPVAERSRWRLDLEAIRALGFNSVRTWVDWAGTEPARGQYRFEALDQLLELAGESGLKVVVQIFGDPQPDWIGRQYPDAKVVDGRAPGRSPGYCLDHPGVREELRALIAAVSARAARYSSFYAIDPWSGPGTSRICCCPQTLRRFREWLREKYTTLEALDAAWYRTYTDWSDVDPPIESTAPLAELIDWDTFIGFKQQADLEFAARASAPRGPHPTGGHSQLPSVLPSPFVDSRLDDWKMSGAVDYYGSALEPKPAGSGSPWPAADLAAALDGIRSAGGDRGWWLAALQAGQAVAGAAVAPPVTPADLRLWSWAALSRGARAAFYYAWFPMSAGSDAGGFGLVALDGTLTGRARAAGAFAGIVSRNPALFAPLRPRPSAIAILYTPSSWLRPGPSAGGPDRRDSLLGLYRALFERNLPVDFVHADEVAAGGAAAYKAIFLPAPLVVDERLARALASYVRSGGTIVSEARPAWRDERGRANAHVPGFGLDEVFGARESELRPVERVEMLMERELDGPLSTLSGKSLPGASYAESLEIIGSNVRVIARFAGTDGAPGDPAIVMSRYGAGRAVLIGSLPGAAIGRDPEGARLSGDFMAALAASAGVRPDVRLSGATNLVETRYLESSAVTMLIAINHASSPRQVTMTFPPDTPEAIWLNLETGASVNFVAGPDGPIYRHAFEPRDVLVLMIKRDLR